MGAFNGGLFCERFQIHPFATGTSAAAGPASTDLTAASLVSDEIVMEGVNRLLLLVLFNDGTTTSGDVTVTLEQATALGGTYKDLACLQTGRIFTKTNASSLAAVAAWTQITKATAAASFTGTAAGDLGSSSGALTGMFALEVLPSDLDAANNYDVVRATLSTPTGSQKLVCGIFIAEMAFDVAPANAVSIIA